MLVTPVQASSLESMKTKFLQLYKKRLLLSYQRFPPSVGDGMKREQGENPGHYPMLYASSTTFLLPMPLSRHQPMGRPQKGEVSQKTCLCPDSYRDHLSLLSGRKAQVGQRLYWLVSAFLCI